ncbi:MAG: hypothetical protein LAP85_28260 [Acidobacteriia bacterium]|nr:hypothetical protein [Terriglobia bacterium]
MTILILLFTLFGMSFSQSDVKADRLAAVRFFVGQWHGTATGEPGKGTVVREYLLVLGGKFLQGKNVSHWAATEKTPTGEIHEDMGFFSFDNARKTVIYRQFHIEGFVNQYAMQPIQDPKTLVFVSEAIENIAPGWRAKETYHILGNDEFEEVFELAAPGKEFEVYSKSSLRRTK